MVFHGLEVVYLSQAKPAIEIVCVHGLGAQPETTWHHDESGKTWIEDEDFLEQLKRSVRVSSLSWNADLAANLLPPSISYHAMDLLTCLEQSLGNVNAGQHLVLIAHGFGGLIVKKAVHMAFSSLKYMKVRSRLAGIVFLGTPHATTNSSALLNAVRQTVVAFGGKEDSISEDEIRSYAAAVAKINEVFEDDKPVSIKLLSIWEKLQTKIDVSGGDSYETLIVPTDCRKDDLSLNTNHVSDSNHRDLARFRDVFDPRFCTFAESLSDLLDKIVQSRPNPIPVHPPPPPRPQPGPVSAAYSPSSSPASSRAASPIRASRPPNFQGSPSGRNSSPVSRTDQRFQYWKRTTEAKEAKDDQERFLASLAGWSESNSGNHLHVAEGTCEWIAGNGTLNLWKQDRRYISIFFLGHPGLGLSHLAKEIASYLRHQRPFDTVFTFHCTPGTARPAIWEYFTRMMIQRDSSCFDAVPARYSRRTAKDPPLTGGDFVEIWRAMRRLRVGKTVYFIIDGLEQCGDDNFKQINSELIQAASPVGPVQANPASLKILYTCRATPCAKWISKNASRFSDPPGSVSEDISTFVDVSLSKVERSVRHASIQAIDKVKDCIKEKAGFYWPYAVAALADVEAHTPGMLCTEVLRDDYIPEQLSRWLAGHILPVVQSVDNDISLRLALLLISSTDSKHCLKPRGLEVAVASLMNDANHASSTLMDKLREKLGDVIWQKDNGDLVFAHDSFYTFMDRLFPKDQRNETMAYLCLTYLMREEFREELRLLWDNREQDVLYLYNELPFYSFAAMEWNTYLSRVKSIGPKLLGVLKAFLRMDCQQYRTYALWLGWRVKDTKHIAQQRDIPIMALVNGECLSALQTLLKPPIPGIQAKTDRHGVLGFLKTHQWRSHEPDLEVSKWPLCMNTLGQTPLTTAAIRGNLDMVRFMLQWPIDVNYRLPSIFRWSILMECAARPDFAEKARQYLAICTEFLRMGTNPNLFGSCGEHALMSACKNGCLELADLLCQYGADVCSGDTWHNTPLEQACLQDNAALVEFLIRKGAEVDIWSYGSFSLFTRCIDQGHMNAFKVLLLHANVNMKDPEGAAPIHRAARRADRIDFLRLLLTRPEIDLYAVHYLADQIEGETNNALGLAVANENIDAVKMLLEAGAHPGIMPGVTLPPLCLAVELYDIEFLQTLLAYAAPVNEINRKFPEKTALSRAAYYGETEMVQILLEHGADPTTEDGYGFRGPLYRALEDYSSDTARDVVELMLKAPIPPDLDFIPDGEDHILIRAVELEDAALLRTLLEHGIDMSVFLRQGMKSGPLHKAAALGFVEGCKILLEFEPQLINVQLENDELFETALITASHEMEEDVVKVLLEHGARAGIKSLFYEKTALYRACKAGDYETAKMLLEADPEMIDTPSYLGCTPLGAASYRGNLSILEMLLDAGADFRCKDAVGNSFFAMNLFYEYNGKRPHKVIELFLERGFDINEVVTYSGHTILAEAIEYGKVEDVKWLLEHGADPIRCQHGLPGTQTYLTALQTAVYTTASDVIELLLEPRWGLREHLDHAGWAGFTMLPDIAPVRGTATPVSLIANACEEIRRETGRDIFDELVHRQTISGLSPLDYRLGMTGVTAEARPQFDKALRELIDETLNAASTMDGRGDFLDCITQLLGVRGEFDEELIILLSHVASRPRVKTEDGRNYLAAKSKYSCAGCGESIFEELSLCRLCEWTWGATCCKEDKVQELSLHRHEWLTVPLILEWDFGSEEVENALRRVRDGLAREAEASPAEDQGIDKEAHIEDNIAEEDHALQSSLQLATLHAFGYLAVQKRTLVPYLPLSRQAEETIFPWLPMIQDQRRAFERRSLEYEMSPERCWEEWRYFTKGMYMAFVDVDLIRQDLILADLEGLFGEKEEVKKAPSSVGSGGWEDLEE